MSQNFSVLMSVYRKEKVENLEQALHSVLIDQTMPPTQLVLVEDGPLSEELYTLIEKYKRLFSEKLDIVTLKENMGLGSALNKGLKYCKYELVARMDSDDICIKDRFEKQIAYLETHINIAICGGFISEFYEDASNIVSVKKMPLTHDKIIYYMKMRNPMNHVTVMFRKKAVLDAGGYRKLLYLEDYDLWIRMFEKGYCFANLNDILVNVRTGNNMFKRRGSREQIAGWFFLQRKMYSIKHINIGNVIRNMMAITAFIYCPVTIKRYLYENILRKSV